MKKYVNGRYEEMTAQEIAELTGGPAPESQQEQLARLEQRCEMLVECLLEISQAVYGGEVEV